MRIDIFLQYYKPHVSGLTNAAAAAAEYMAGMGLEVQVHSVGLGNENRHEIINGVIVNRYRGMLKIGRATFAPRILLAMLGLRNKETVAHFHLPYPESILGALLLPKKFPRILTYHCDSGITDFKSKLIAKLLDQSHKILFRRASKIVFTSSDYAQHSRMKKHLATKEITFIPPQCVDRSGGATTYRTLELQGKFILGFLGRPTSEKGLDVLFEALNMLPNHFHLLLAGPHEGLKESPAHSLLSNLENSDRVSMLGKIEETKLRDFYASIDAFVLPSINSFEAFGITQVEAMTAGKPVVASDLPGVRTIVAMTNFGLICEANNAQRLFEALERIEKEQPKPTRGTIEILKNLTGVASQNLYFEMIKQTFNSVYRNDDL